MGCTETFIGYISLIGIKYVFFDFIFEVDIYSLSRKWKELVDKARAKQLQPHEYNIGNVCMIIIKPCKIYLLYLLINLILNIFFAPV